MSRFTLACELRKVIDGGAPAYVGALPDGTRVKIRPMDGGKALAVFLEQDDANVTRASRDRHALSRTVTPGERSASAREASPASRRTIEAGTRRRRMTAAEIDAHRSAKGGWSRAGLAKMGVPWPPPKGWRQALLRGEPIPAQIASRRDANRDAKSLKDKQTMLADASKVLAGCYSNASGLLPVCYPDPARPAYVGPIRDRRTGEVVDGAEAEASPLAFKPEFEAPHLGRPK